MKKLPILLIAFVALLGLNSCSSDDDVVFIAQPDMEGIAFLNTFSSNYILTPATGPNVAERFVWNQIDVDVPTNVQYEVQGSTSSSFEDITVMGSTSDNNLAITVKQLLDLAEEAGFDSDPETEAPNAGTLYFRVVASVGTGGDLAHSSEPQALTVTLPEGGDGGGVSYRNFFMVGDVTAAGWSENNNNTPLFRDGENPDLYHFTGRFDGAADKEGFKLLEVLGSWQPQWGLDDTGALSNSDILGGDPQAFPVEENGYYTLTINADEMTFSFEDYDASGAETYASIGIVGDATPGGWDSDTMLTQTDFDPHLWYASGVELIEGEFKFRVDGDWAMNWGGSSFPSGEGVFDGGNILAEEGTYDIWFNDITKRYILIAQ